MEPLGNILGQRACLTEGVHDRRARVHDRRVQRLDVDRLQLGHDRLVVLELFPQSTHGPREGEHARPRVGVLAPLICRSCESFGPLLWEAVQISVSALSSANRQNNVIHTLDPRRPHSERTSPGLASRQRDRQHAAPSAAPKPAGATDG